MFLLVWKRAEARPIIGVRGLVCQSRNEHGAAVRRGLSGPRLGGGMLRLGLVEPMIDQPELDENGYGKQDEPGPITRIASGVPCDEQAHEADQADDGTDDPEDQARHPTSPYPRKQRLLRDFDPRRRMFRGPTNG